MPKPTIAEHFVSPRSGRRYWKSGQAIMKGNRKKKTSRRMSEKEGEQWVASRLNFSARLPKSTTRVDSATNSHLKRCDKVRQEFERTLLDAYSISLSFASFNPVDDFAKEHQQRPLDVLANIPPHFFTKDNGWTIEGLNIAKHYRSLTIQELEVAIMGIREGTIRFVLKPSNGNSNNIDSVNENEA